MDDNKVIWRYMDFTKFVSVLENNGLFFSSLDKVGDQFEMAIPKRNSAYLNKIYDQTVGLDYPDISSTDFFKFAFNKCSVLISSWHINKYESAAMWSSYLKSNEGIAIQSTSSRLVECLNCEDKVHLKEVHYIDYDSDKIPSEDILSIATHKLKSYEHEKELRAIIIGQFDKKTFQPLYEFGKMIDVDLNKLIEKIYVAPNSPDWFFELIKSIVERYNYFFEVVKSDLKDNSIH